MISNVQAELVNLLRYAPKDNRIHAFIKELESVSSADIIQNADLNQTSGKCSDIRWLYVALHEISGSICGGR